MELLFMLKVDCTMPLCCLKDLWLQAAYLQSLALYCASLVRYFEIFMLKLVVFFSTGGESITSQFVWGVWRLIILQTGLSEYFSLISLGGWSGSGHVLMGPSISWLSTEPGLWLRHSHTVAALASQLLHPPLNILCVLQSMCISDRELSKGRCSGFKFIPENLIEKYVLDL